MTKGRVGRRLFRVTLVLPHQVPGVPHPGATLAYASPGVVFCTRNMGVDIVDAKQESLKQRFERLLGQRAELIVTIQPATLLTLITGLTDPLLGIEVAVHGAISDVHAGYHQHPRIGQRFNDSASHYDLRNVA